MDRDQLLFPVLRKVAANDWSARLLNPLLAPYNPFDPERHESPYAGYSRLRDIDPVFLHPRLGSWLVTGHAETEQILRSPHSSVGDRARLLIVRPYSQLEPKVAEFFASWLISLDPPDHTRLRSLISRAFTPRSIQMLEGDVEQIANDLLDRFDPSGPVDVMTSYADQLPIQVIGRLLGIPSKDWAWLKTASDEIVRYVDPINGFDPVVMNRLVNEVSDYFDNFIEHRRANPADDLVTRLIEATDDGDRLSVQELISMVSLVMGAGHETTTNLIGNALLALDADPAARTLLLSRPELATNAVEEFLRFDAPVQLTQRFLDEPIEVGGHLLPIGTDITVFLGAGNRDPRRHRRPNELLLDRDDPHPLSFGSGIHHCVGAALARMEARVAIMAFVNRFGGYSVDRDGLVRKSTLTLRGPRTLPVFLG